VEAGTAEVIRSKTVTVDVNGTSYEREVDARRLLIHFLRDELALTGSHVGCDTGNCGACSVIVDGMLLKSCMMLAVQADGASIQTVEGLGDDDELDALQQSFSRHQPHICPQDTILQRNQRIRIQVVSIGPKPVSGGGWYRSHKLSQRGLRRETNR
jgi:hypothetical protein